MLFAGSLANTPGSQPRGLTTAQISQCSVDLLLREYYQVSTTRVQRYVAMLSLFHCSAFMLQYTFLEMLQYTSLEMHLPALFTAPQHGPILSTAVHLQLLQMVQSQHRPAKHVVGRRGSSMTTAAVDV